MAVNQSLQTIAQLMAKNKHTVVVTGAGISTEAGVPDFRGKQGIYHQLGEDRVMNLIHTSTLHEDPETFFSFYRKYFTLPRVEPSKAHKMVAAMEAAGLVKAVVTQNVDELHQKAGSRNVFAIHGSRAHYHCMKVTCGKSFSADYAENYPETVPRCDTCGSVIRPGTVLFGEAIKYHGEALDAVLQAKVLLVIGTSLTVYPLAGFVQSFRQSNDKLIIINQGSTALDHLAYCKYDAPHTGDALEEILGIASAITGN